MRTYVNNLLKSDEDRLSRRGETIYYFGTLFFVAGIILLAYASASIMLFQINYRSDPKIIVETFSYMGAGLFFVSFGINLMLRQSKRGYITFSTGSVFCLVAITSFYFYYVTDNFVYPTISYILLGYLLGFLLLMGNAFGHVTLWIMRKNQQIEEQEPYQRRTEYTDEQIEKDIDAAIKESILNAAEELQFDLSDTPSFRVSAAADSETVVKRKDSMDEAMVLQQTLNPGGREKWGGTGVDKASLLLDDALNAESSGNKGIFSFFKSFFSKK